MNTGNFLGTAIVSLHELQKSPSQRQIIPLQSRPLMDDLVSGSLTLEVSASPPTGSRDAAWFADLVNAKVR